MKRSKSPVITAWRRQMLAFLARECTRRVIPHALLSMKHLESDRPIQYWEKVHALSTHGHSISRSEWLAVRSDLSTALDRLLEIKGWTIKRKSADNTESKFPDYEVTTGPSAID